MPARYTIIFTCFLLFTLAGFYFGYVNNQDALWYILLAEAIISFAVLVRSPAISWSTYPVFAAASQFFGSAGAWSLANWLVAGKGGWTIAILSILFLGMKIIVLTKSIRHVNALHVNA